MQNDSACTWIKMYHFKLKLNIIYKKGLVELAVCKIGSLCGEYWLLLRNALVLSHLHYPAIIITGILMNLLRVLEKQKPGSKSIYQWNEFRSYLGFKIQVRYFDCVIFFKGETSLLVWMQKNLSSFLRGSPTNRAANSQVCETQQNELANFSTVCNTTFRWNCCLKKQFLWRTPYRRILGTKSMPLKQSYQIVMVFSLIKWKARLKTTNIGKAVVIVSDKPFHFFPIKL